MEKIDLNNYEAYFLDLMEGTLSAEEKHDLFAFLELHPELKEEMEDFIGNDGMVELMPEKVLFAEKESLKIDEGSLIIIPATVDDLMIASVEGQLVEKHKQQLESYVKAEELEKTYAYYQATLLKPDTSLVYADKQGLKVKTGVVISLPFITRVASIAAVGIILITLAVSNWNAPGTIKTNEEGIFAGNPKDHILLDMMKTQREVDQMQENGTNLFQDSNSNVPRQENRRPNNLENELIKEDLNNAIADLQEGLPQDTASVQPQDQDQDNPNNPKDINPANDSDGFANNEEQEEESDDTIVLPLENESDDVAMVSVKKEEPYKIVTDMAQNIVKRDVEFTREKDVASNDYVAYGFKLGKFEFERKKASK